MEHKIFLGKYRVAADEIALGAAEPAAIPAASEPHTPARIYRGQEIDSGREVAVEVIPATALKDSVREKLEAEASAAKQLNHVNIPALYDFGFEDNQLIYVTEYFDGTSAEEWVNQHGAMPTGAILRIALQVIGAMGAASFHKISHHAINPGNLILVPGQTPEGDWPLIKVLHFVGVAPTFQEADTSVASFDKSTHYASPEQIQHGKVDFRSEIYSLGATMWFLLTGAPPLMAPKGPLAMQPTTIGLAVDKLSGMPKRVRRLLVHMLAANPADRPQDQLALYRQIQDSIAQVDRRESMARRFGVPFLSGSNVVALPSRRRFPVKTVALAAAILAVAIAAAVMIPQYLRHQRIRQAQEPIGVPIGVPETTQSAAPVTASAPTIAPPPQPEQTAPPTNDEQNQPPAVSQSTPVVAANNQPVAPPPAPHAETTTAPESPKVAANEQSTANTEPPPKPVTQVREEKPVSTDTQIAATTARPVSPEVRRAEPAPPAEGPEEVAPATEKKVVTTAKPKKEKANKPKREPEEEAIPRAEPVEDEEVAERPLPQLPKGRTRARFIGVTADGNWMFSLPNKKIVVVPPPPGG
jgi:eukaryotic-like serine/threonine-protein kinase